MKAKMNVTLHNRFDIEVRDSVTGELKQKAQAFNIVLDTMWTRLCGGSTYFVNIAYGTGTGTLAASRTTLFTYLGYKAATDVELVKEVPNASWKRKIVLNPEDNVGAVLTEVGISYSAGSIVTHAMIEDVEGNPISITKTAVDLVTIYATVYVTFAPDTDDTVLTYLPDSNALVNYLIGGTTLPSVSFRLGSGGDAGTQRMRTLQSTDLGATATATWTSDVPNKQRKTAAMRFGTTVANGHVQEFSLDKFFRTRLPATGIFTGQEYTGVPIGTGDGDETEFVLPSNNINQSSITIKEDGVENTDITKTLFCSMFNFAIANSSEVSGGNGYGVALTPDGSIIAIATEGTPFVAVYDWEDSAWIRRANPADLPPNDGNDVALSSDGTVLAVAHDDTPYVTTYDWTDGAWIKRANPVDLPPGNCYSAALSSDGTVLAVAHSTSPRVTTYDWTDGAWIKRANPVDLPPDSGQSVALTPDGLIMAIGHSTTPYITTYDWSGGAWVKRPNPVDLPNFNGTGCAFSSDGSVLAVSNSLYSPYITTYDWSGSAWIKRADPVDLPTGTAGSVALTPDGLIMAVGCDITPYIFVYDWIDSAWVKRTDPSTTLNRGYGVALSSDGQFLGMSVYSSVNLGAYDLKKRQTKITFDTAPALGVAITADYTVDGVHKTDQYVVDCSAIIQFGEPA